MMLSPNNGGGGGGSNNNNNCNVISSMSLLYITIGLNIWFHHDPSILEACSNNGSSNYLWFNWHSHKYSSNLSSILISMFSHADWEHVLSNMFCLWVAGRKVFDIPSYASSTTKNNIDTSTCPITSSSYSNTAVTIKDGKIIRPSSSSSSSSKQNGSSSTSINSSNHGYDHWINPWSFVWIYFGSQIICVLGCRLLSYKFDLEWDRKLASSRKSWSKSKWSSWVPNKIVDISTNVLNLDQYSRFKLWQYIPTIGASAAVYGVIGAHVYTSLFINHRGHPGTMDISTLLFWISKLAIEISYVPFSIEEFSNKAATIPIGHTSSNPQAKTQSNIDHAAHLSGFIGGIIMTATWDYIYYNIQRKRCINRRRRGFGP